MQQQHHFHRTAIALPEGQPFTEPKNALRISHKSDHPRLQGWGEQHQTQGNFDNEKNRHSFTARPPACLQWEGTQLAFCCSLLISLQHTRAAFSSTHPQPLFVPSQLWEMGMGPAGLHSSAVPSPAPAEALGLHETLHETNPAGGQRFSCRCQAAAQHKSRALHFDSQWINCRDEPHFSTERGKRLFFLAPTPLLRAWI